MAGADTFEVNSNNSALPDGDCAMAPGGCSLADAIGEANDSPGSDTITFASTVTGSIIPVVDLPPVTGNLVLNGPGRDVLSISGGDARRLLYIDPLRTVVITDLTFERGRSEDAPEQGAAIYAGDGANLRVFRSAFTDNKALDLPPGSVDPAGGAIYAGLSSSLKVFDSNFSGNVAEGDGFHHALGGAIASRGSVEITRSTLSGNLATAESSTGGRGYGGALWVQSDEELEIRDSTLSGNEAGAEFGSGGAIFAYAEEVMVVNSTISGNEAGSRGGAGLFGTSSGYIDSSTIADNYARRSGGGLYGVPGFMDPDWGLLSTIVADNATAGGAGGDDVYSFGVSVSYSLVEDSDSPLFQPAGGSGNVFGVDPSLAPLAANGGPTRTHAITIASPAFGAGATDLEADQRGVLRPQGGAADIGAFELSVGPRTTLSSAPSGTIFDPTPTIVFSSADPDVARFECSVDGGAYVTCTSPFTVPALAPGEHRIEVRAIDADGETGEPAVATFTLGTPASGGSSAKGVDDPDVSTDKTQKQSGKQVKVKIKAGAQEAVKIVARGRITVKGNGGKGKRAGAGGRDFQLATVRKSTEAGEQTVLRLKPKRKQDNHRILRLLRRGKDLRANPSVKLTDVDGNSVVEKRVVRLKAKKK